MKITVENLIAIYESALISKPNNHLVYNRLAELYYARGNFVAAFDVYQRALQLQPEFQISNKNIKQHFVNIQNITEKVSSELYKWNILDIKSLDNGLDTIDLLYTDELDGILVKNVFSTKEIETAREHIDSLSPEFEQIIYGEKLGFSIMEATNDLNKYFQKASEFRLQLNQIFASEFETRIFNVFNHLHSLKNIKLLDRKNHDICIPAQIRIVHPGKGGLKAHTDNEVFEKYQVYNHLEEIKKDVDILSYFIVIDKPEKGGELVLYDLLREQTTVSMKQDFYNCERDNFLDNFRKQYINPDIGDMVISNGGRIWHKVADFDGDKNRITVGGFLARSQDNQTIYCVT
ncbi:tetratricopeptide repeat protein [Calothrix sp. CCY 0018]|uniref:tetratricopeptide repeat protein n=1 Tax=Calothrix sp. CCY 0018 TaxID=3103864 RepID=UPI0039C713C6